MRSSMARSPADGHDPAIAPYVTAHATRRSDLPMSRSFTHAALRPFRVTWAASRAHRQHGPTPFLGCAVCARLAARPVRPFAASAG